VLPNWQKEVPQKMKNLWATPKTHRHLAIAPAKDVLIGARFGREEAKAVQKAVKRAGEVKSEWVRATLLTAAKSS